MKNSDGEKKKTTVGQTLAQRFSSVVGPDIKYRIKTLSELEYQVARMTADGLTTKEISDRLSGEMERDISDQMIRGYYRNQVYKKLGIPSSILMLCVAMDGTVPVGCVFKGLTDRQNDIARLLFVGMNGKEMAQALGLEEKTIKNHLRVMRKALCREGNTEDVGNPAKLLKALRRVMIHDEAHSSWLSALYDSQEKAEDGIVPPKLG